MIGAGGLVLLSKAIFFLRRSSSGLGASQQSLGIAPLPGRANQFAPQALPALPMLFCYLLQDFGGGCMMVGWILDKAMHHSSAPGKYSLIIPVMGGGGLFLTGWLFEKLLRSRELSGPPQLF
jgi:hypothetical protein